ncbi:TPA: 3-oxoacyl-[acyl-carrier-protein] synthase III C-terminal domain-containing protein [Serratia fonticola]|uniref:3-oxoacyl-[acyl-carrier-protein] synthase III C-terminal domain-containing protein n=1 Tax=Serratia fonticola TaxID=47917 RepID=UPI0034C63A13
MKIIDVATHINPELTGLDALNERYQWGERNQKIFSRFLKLESSCLFPEHTLLELLQTALQNLLVGHKEKRSAIMHVIYAHSLHATYPFETRFIEQWCHQHIGTHVECLSVTQGSCASSLLGIELLQRTLARKSAHEAPKYAILLTGDKCFHGTVQYVDQNGFFGEGCSATLLTNDDDAPGLTITSLAWNTMGVISHRTVSSNREQANAYDRAFIPTMTNTIVQALQAAQIEPQQVEIILPYHMSPPTFDRLVDRLNIPRERIYRKNLYRIGHCFCGDAFINLHDYWRLDQQRRPGGPILCMAAGVAGTFSALVLT